MGVEAQGLLSGWVGGWCKCYLACFPIRAKSASQPWAGEAASSTSRAAAIPHTFLKSLHIILAPLLIELLSHCYVFGSILGLGCLSGGGGRHSTDSLVRRPALTHSDKPPAAQPPPVLERRFLHFFKIFERFYPLETFLSFATNISDN